MMSYRLAIVGTLILGLLATTAKSEPMAVATGQRPNIILVLIDDMGWGDFSCFGNKEIQTTNIDRMAEEGLRFHQFYVNSPICSPSRIAISTGQYPARWQITSYLASRKENERRGIANWLDPKAPMLARILHNNGYATGHFGKWHMGGQRDVADAPLITQYGFDESLTSLEGLGPRVLHLLDAYDGKEPQKYSLGADKLGHGQFQWVKRDKATIYYVDAAISFVDKAQAHNQPFYVNVWPDDVHSPFFPPKELRNDTSKRGLYLSVLKALDDQLAPLFNRIRNDSKLKNNTLIFIYSDNGPEDGAGSAGPFRGSKGLLYEGGIRSPLIVWGPGYIAQGKAGSVNTVSTMAAIDLAPSVLQIAKVSKPDNLKFDGENIANTLLGRSTDSRTKPIFFRRPPDRPRHNHEGNLPDLAVRDGKWKLLCEYNGSEPELYNLEADVRESSNVAEANPSIVERLADEVVGWNNSLPADKGATYTALGKVRNKKRAISK